MRNIKVQEVKEGKYYKLSNEYNPNDDCIVYAYKNNDKKLFDVVTDNPNFGKLGFGFNIADGGAWIPLWDIKKDSTIVEVEFVEK